MRTQLSPPKRGIVPILAHVCCGQTYGWIKMPLGTVVGLGLGYTVLDWDPAPSPSKGAPQPPLFGRYLLWPNSWIDQDNTRYRCRFRPRRRCVRWERSCPTERGIAAPSLFGPLWNARSPSQQRLIAFVQTVAHPLIRFTSHI